MRASAGLRTICPAAGWRPLTYHVATESGSRAVQQRRGGLNQSLPDTRFVFLNNRTPDCFQRFVREPELAAIEEITGVLEVAASFLGGHD